jgi:hypothetical protein
MHPYIAQALAEEHRQDLARQTAESRRGPVRGLPRLHLTWSRTRLSTAGRDGSSLMIIITAQRPA